MPSISFPAVLGAAAELAGGAEGALGACDVFDEAAMVKNVLELNANESWAILTLSAMKFYVLHLTQPQI